MASKNIYDMTPQEAIEHINAEVGQFIEQYNKGELTDSFFHSIEWSNERLFNLYFAYRVIIFNDKYSSEVEDGYEKPYELVESEFHRRIGVSPEGAITAISL